MNLFNHPLTGTPFGAALDLCIVLAAAVWLLSVVTREVSWVDRAWSICPAIYCLMVAFADGFDSSRVSLMSALVFLWSVRLTFNFFRKGGFQKGGEDYRWDAVRKQMGPVGFQLLNIVFIAPAQMLLIWLFTSPIHQAWVWREVPLNWLDVAAAGLFRYSRHPNYFCELGMRWTFYLFAIAASGQWIHWTGLGFILLTALFIPSLRLTESISAAKYPGYRDYQDSTPALIPLPRIGC